MHARVHATRDLEQDVPGEIQKLIHAIVTQPVLNASPLLFTGDEATVVQAGEVVRDIGLTETGEGDDLSDSLRTSAQRFQDRET
jgi:hypothetical protein